MGTIISLFKLIRVILVIYGPYYPHALILRFAYAHITLFAYAHITIFDIPSLMHLRANYLAFNM